MSGPRPATPEDVARVHLRFDSLFTRPSLQEHTRGNPGLCWVNDHDEYVVGGRWKARREIAEVLELSGPGRGLRGLLPASRAETYWPEGRGGLVEELGVDAIPAHSALSDAQATAAVFRELVRRGREMFGWQTVGDVLVVLVRPDVDRSALESRRAQRIHGRRNRPRRTGPVCKPPAPA